MERSERSPYWDKVWQRRLSRRTALRGGATAALGAAGWALVGCSDDDDPTATATAPAATATSASGSPTASPTATSAAAAIDTTGILQLRHSNITPTINPYKDITMGFQWGFYVFDHLFSTPIDTGAPELLLAESIELPDDLTVNFKLKESYFHDIAPVSGRRVLSTDIKHSYEQHILAPDLSCGTYWTQTFAGVDAPDDVTAIIRHNTPNAWTFSQDNLGSPQCSSVMPEEFAFDPDRMDTDLIGSGRFQFVSHQAGANFVVERFDNWRNPGRPYPAGIHWNLIQDQALAIAAFADKKVDVLELANARERDQLMDQLPSDLFSVEEVPSRQLVSLYTRGDGQWSDPRVNQAISMALDRQEMVDLILFGAGQPSGLVPPVFADFQLSDAELNEQWLKFDPGAARAMLEASGFDMEFEYDLNFHTLFPNNSLFAEVAKAQLEKNLGLKIRLVGEDINTWLSQRFQPSTYNGFLMQTLEVASPPTYMVFYQKEIGGRPNWASFINDELDGLYVEQQQVIDLDERIELVKTMQTRGWELGAPFIPCYVGFDLTARWNHLKDWVSESRGHYANYDDGLWIDTSEA
jgi:peptide/nickel transport system substrate-binding protein